MLYKGSLLLRYFEEYSYDIGFYQHLYLKLRLKRALEIQEARVYQDIL